MNNVGDLWGGTESLNSLLDNSFTSLVGNVGSVGESFSPTFSLSFNLPTVSTSVSEAQSFAPTSFNTQPTKVQQNGFVESPQVQVPVQPQPKLEEEASANIQWLLELLADLESALAPNPRFTDNEYLIELFNQAEKKGEMVSEALAQVCPDYWERFSAAIGRISEALSELDETCLSPACRTDRADKAQSVSEVCAEQEEQKHFPPASCPVPELVEGLPSASASELTLPQLKAKLLACQTLTELKALTQGHQEQVSQAYQELSPSQQLQVDGIAATAVPHGVYKYTGPTLESQGQKLSPGELVYIDPNAKVRSSDLHVPIWLIEGLKCGWQQAVSVSRSCLILVEKAVTAVTEVIEGETGNLLDGLA